MDYLLGAAQGIVSWLALSRAEAAGAASPVLEIIGKALLIGPVAVEAPVLTVLNTDFGIGDAIISEEFLEGRRLWLSFRNRQVFISRGGQEP